MADVENTTEEIESWFMIQDINKKLKLNVTTEEQLKEVERIDAKIMQKLKELYVPQHN